MTVPRFFGFHGIGLAVNSVYRLPVSLEGAVCLHLRLSIRLTKCVSRSQPSTIFSVIMSDWIIISNNWVSFRQSF